jgi:transcriptional regulator with XRE-family HTH domain
MSIFATRLKELRGTESQASFATAIDLNRVQYAKYESGANSPSVEVLERICRVHACSADWLLGLKDNGGVNIKAGDGAAVAIGSHAKATSNSKLSTPASLTPNCSKCAYLKKLKKLESILGKQS